MTRQIRSSVKRMSRLPAWAVAVAVAFLLGAVVGPLAVSAQPVAGSGRDGAVSGAARWHHHPYMSHVFVIMLENTSYKDR